MAVRIEKTFSLTAHETLDDNVAGVGSPNIVHDRFNGKAEYTSSTTVPVSDVIDLQPTLGAGVLTIDFTALTQAGGGTVDMTGKKLQQLLFTNGSTDSNGAITAGSNSLVTITEGASNGYPIFGSGNTLEIKPGQQVAMDFAEQGADVAAGDATIDLAGTGTDAFEMRLVFG